MGAKHEIYICNMYIVFLNLDSDTKIDHKERPSSH